MTVNGVAGRRISIFLNVFDVHVNRSPISGVIRDVRYQRGKFMNAMNPACAEENEQNSVTVEGEGQILVFKQIAGLLARRIVFYQESWRPGGRGERVGLIKFGSRTDVLLDVSANVQIKVGDRVKGGSTVLAYFHGDKSLVGDRRGTDSARSSLMEPEVPRKPEATERRSSVQAPSQGHVYTALAVYHGKHRFWLLRNSSGHACDGSRAMAL